MNLYAYCGNNPVNWIDPLGLLFEDSSSKYPPGSFRGLLADTYHGFAYLGWSGLGWSARLTAGLLDQPGDPYNWGPQDLLGFVPGVSDSIRDFSDHAFENAARHNNEGWGGTLPHNDSIYDVYLEPLGYTQEQIGGPIPSEEDFVGPPEPTKSET